MKRGPISIAFIAMTESGPRLVSERQWWQSPIRGDKVRIGNGHWRVTKCTFGVETADDLAKGFQAIDAFVEPVDQEG